MDRKVKDLMNKHVGMGESRCVSQPMGKKNWMLLYRCVFWVDTDKRLYKSVKVKGEMMWKEQVWDDSTVLSPK